MPLSLRWRKPVFYSGLLHSLLLPFFLYNVSFLATEPPADALIELALDNQVMSEPAAVPTPVVDASGEAFAAETALPLTAGAIIEETVIAAPASTASQAGPRRSVAAGSSGGTGTSASGPAAAAPAVIQAPRVVTAVDPVYPAAARSAGWEGSVILKVQVLTSGLPGSISILQSSGQAVLDDAAVAAARQWRFTPARNQATGQAIVSTTRIPLAFRLHN